MQNEELFAIDFPKLKRSHESLQSDIQKVRQLLHDTKLRYLKQRLRARSKKAVEDEKLLFKDLEDYTSEDQIDDAYGWDLITEKERERLHLLWEARREYSKNGVQYSDRITEMLDRLIGLAGSEYAEYLERFESIEHVRKKYLREFLIENPSYSFDSRIRAELNGED